MVVNLKCPYCGNGDTRIFDTRTKLEGKVRKRRRRCSACGKPFSTFEIPVVKRREGKTVSYKVPFTDIPGLKESKDKRNAVIKAVITRRVKEQTDFLLLLLEMIEEYMQSQKAKDYIEFMKEQDEKKNTGDNYLKLDGYD